MTLPLADVRVVAVEQYGAGPWGTLQLADLGAEVIKIEDPALEAATSAATCRRTRRARTRSSSRRSTATRRASRSTSAAPRREASSRTSCAPPTSSTRTSAATSRRSSASRYEQLTGRQSARRVLLALGLRHDRPAGCRGRLRLHDAGAGGLDEPDRRARRPADEVGPLARRSLGRLRLGDRGARRGSGSARRDGVGCDCDISLFETALAELMYVGTWVATSGYEPRRMPSSAHPSIVPFQNFRTADGWIVVACPKPKFWELLCDAIGRPELRDDPRFADFAARDANRDELLPILEEAFAARTSARMARRPRTRRHPGLRDQRRRRRARRPPGRRPRRRRRARPPCVRPGPNGRDAAASRRGGEARTARSVPRRAHRAGPRRGSAATTPRRSPSSAQQGCSGRTILSGRP